MYCLLGARCCPPEVSQGSKFRGRSRWKLASEPAGKDICSLKLTVTVLTGRDLPFTLIEVSAISGLYFPCLVTMPRTAVPAGMTATPST